MSVVGAPSQSGLPAIVPLYPPAEFHSTGQGQAVGLGFSEFPVAIQQPQSLVPDAGLEEGTSADNRRVVAVAAEIGKIAATEPQRGVALYEAFLAGCHAKADELDDSSNSFGEFAQRGRAGELKLDWTKPLHDARPMGIE